MSSVVNIERNIFLKGHFHGKYQSDQYFSNNYFNLSNIYIVEGILESASFTNFSELFNLTNTLNYVNPLTIEIDLKDDAIENNFLFVEDVNNVILTNVELNNNMKDDNKSFGVIKGDFYCSIPSNYDLEIKQKTSYIINRDIQFDEPFKKRTKHINQSNVLFKLIKRQINKVASFFKLKKKQ